MAKTQKQVKVIIIDDDPVVLMILQAMFVREGWSVATAENGADGLRLIREQLPDLVVLDLMLPVVNGWEICKMLREESAVPILMLTALDQEDHLIKGLRLGADDYVTKPFSPREVMARVQAILRRARPDNFAKQPIKAGSLCLAPAHRTAMMSGGVLTLTPAEFRILYHLVLNKDTAVSRPKILALSSGQGDLTEGMERTADVHIKNLRRKLAEASGRSVSIETVRGIGYKLCVVKEGGKALAAINLQTLMTCLVVVGMSLFFCLVVYRKYQKTYRGFEYWLASFACFTMMLALMSLRGAISDVLSIAVANLLGIAAMHLLYRGFCLFNGSVESWHRNSWPASGAFAALVYFSTWQDDILMRTIKSGPDFDGYANAEYGRVGGNAADPGGWRAQDRRHADDCTDRAGDEGRPGTLPAGRRQRLHCQTGRFQ